MKITPSTQRVIDLAIHSKIDCAVPARGDDGGDLNRHVGAAYEQWVAEFTHGDKERMQPLFDLVYKELKLLGLSW